MLLMECLTGWFGACGGERVWVVGDVQGKPNLLYLINRTSIIFCMFYLYNEHVIMPLWGSGHKQAPSLWSWRSKFALTVGQSAKVISWTFRVSPITIFGLGP